VSDLATGLGVAAVVKGGVALDYAVPALAQ